jgi:small subunit ribosomal protein S5
METETQKTNTVAPAETSAPVEAVATTMAAEAPSSDSSKMVDRRGPPREFKKNVRKGPRRESKVKPEFDHKIISIRRVTRVVTGGRRFSFSVAVVAGNRKGSVGVGLGKAGDTSIAIDKALRDAKKNMVTVSLNKYQSIPHEVMAKFSASRVVMMPAPGRGIIAGSSVRSVLELAGIKNVSAKIRSGSKNKINNARVAIEALKMLPKIKNQNAKP